MMKLGTVIPYLTKEDPKDIWITSHTSRVLLTSTFFSPEISKFCYIKKYRYRLHFDFFEPLKIILINVVTILIMAAKMATLGPLKIKVFWNKDYDVITSVHYVTNNILIPYSNYIVDVVMWSNCGNSSTFMREVIISSNI